MKMIDQLLIDDVPRNYLVVSTDMYTRYMTVINKISQSLNIPNENILKNPDIKYVSIPVIDKTGKIIDSISNKKLLLYQYGLIDKIDANKIGNEITINQIRDVISFTQISAHKSKKIVIINNASRMNNEASSALLKTLEEVSSNCSFILLTNSHNDIHETIRSRCRSIHLEDEPNMDEYESFEEYFFSYHKFLKNYSAEYDLENLLANISSQIEGLLNKRCDPLEVSNEWNKIGTKFIIEAINSYIIYTIKNTFSSHSSNQIHSIKKLSDIYGKIPLIRNNINLNVSQKYILNNISIELAS